MQDDCEEKQLLVRPSGTTIISLDSNVRGGLSRVNGSTASLSLSTTPMSTPSASSPPPSMCVSVWNGANSASLDQTANSMKFQDLVCRANTEDLSVVDKSRCIFVAGRDRIGRPIIAFIGKWFMYSQLDLDKALLYLIRILHPIACSGDYVVIYFHTKTSSQNSPHYWWIKHVYNTLPYEYKKNLKAFYVMHPTLWTRMTCWWFSTFMAPAIKNKIFNVFALQHLSSIHSLIHDDSDLDLPMFIVEHDMSLHGIRYVKP